MHSAQQLFENLGGKRSVATVSADLGHQEDFVAPTFEAQAEPGLGFAAIVVPGIVVERDDPVEGTVNDIDRGFLVLSATKMVAAQTEYGDLTACFTKVSERNGHVPPSPTNAPRMSRRGGAGQNPFYDIDLEGFSYEFPTGLLQALKVGSCHMLIERSLTCPCLGQIEAPPRV